MAEYDAASSGAVVNQVKREYNGFGQMTREYQQHGAAVNTASSLAVVYAYNTSDLDKYGSRIVSMTYPSGKVLSYRYGTANGLNDLIGRLDNLAESGTVTLESYKYLGMGTVVEREMPQANLKLTYIAQGSGDHSSDSGAYDPYVGLDRFGRVVDQRWRSTGGSPADVDRYQYTYDANSNRLTKTNVLNSSFNETYTYDNLNRLTATDRSSGSTSDQSWSLDALGNMSSVTTNGTAQNRTHNQQNQIETMGAFTLAYDDNGNLTEDDFGRALVYDAWNRLVAVLDQYGILIKAYVYDGLNRRITETDGWASTDLYYSAGWQVLEERKGVTTATGASASSNGYVVALYINSPIYVDAYVLRDRDSDNDGSHTLDQRLYVLQDANFNVTAITNSSGTVEERFVYEAYGQFIVTDSTWSITADTKNWNIQHQGLRLDASAGWYDNRNRVYSPTMMRFGQQDPMGYVDGLNPYSAYKGAPTWGRDPLGNWNIKIDGFHFFVHRNDPDPFPSDPHAHIGSPNTPRKLHIWTGEVYQGAKATGTYIPNKTLGKLQTAMRNAGLLSVCVIVLVSLESVAHASDAYAKGGLPAAAESSGRDLSQIVLVPVITYGIGNAATAITTPIVAGTPALAAGSASVTVVATTGGLVVLAATIGYTTGSIIADTKIGDDTVSGHVGTTLYNICPWCFSW